MSDKIERVQRKFVKFLSFQLRLGCGISYEALCNRFKLQPLYLRRDISDLCMLNKVFCNKVDCPDIVELITLNVPVRRLRFTTLFSQKYRINVRKNSLMIRCQHLANITNLDVMTISNPRVIKKTSTKILLF